MIFELGIFTVIHVCVLRVLQDGRLAPPEGLTDNGTKWRRALFATVVSTIALVVMLAVMGLIGLAAAGSGVGIWFFVLALPVATLVDGLVYQRVFQVPLRKGLVGSSIAVGAADVFTGFLKVLGTYVGGAVLANPVWMAAATALVLAAFGFVWLWSKRQAKIFADVATKAGGDEMPARSVAEPPPKIDLQPIREAWEKEHGSKSANLSRGTVVALSAAMVAAVALLSVLENRGMSFEPDSFSVERVATTDEFIEYAPNVPHEDGWQPVEDGLEAQWYGTDLGLRETGDFVRGRHLVGLSDLILLVAVIAILGVFFSRRRLHRELARAGLTAGLVAVVMFTLQMGSPGLWTTQMVVRDANLALAFPVWLIAVLCLILLPAAAFWGGALAWSLVKWTVGDRECSRCESTGPWSKGGDCLTCGFSGAKIGDNQRVFWGVAALIGAVLVTLVAVLPDVGMAERCENRPAYDDDTCRPIVMNVVHAIQDRGIASWVPLAASDSMRSLVNSRSTFFNRWAYLGFGSIGFLLIGWLTVFNARRRALTLGIVTVAGGWLVIGAITVLMLGGVTDDPSAAVLPTHFMAGAVWGGVGLLGMFGGYRSRRVLEGELDDGI